MSFVQSIATVFRKYADFSGRASMSEFWWFVLFVNIVATILRAVDLFALDVEPTGAGIGTLWTLAIVLPSLAVSVRRLRDGGNSWNQMFWILVPVAGLVIIILRWCDPPRDTSVAADLAERNSPSSSANRAMDLEGP